MYTDSTFILNPSEKAVNKRLHNHIDKYLNFIFFLIRTFDKKVKNLPALKIFEINKLIHKKILKISRNGHLTSCFIQLLIFNFIRFNY